MQEDERIGSSVNQPYGVRVRSTWSDWYEDPAVGENRVSEFVLEGILLRVEGEQFGVPECLFSIFGPVPFDRK